MTATPILARSCAGLVQTALVAVSSRLQWPGYIQKTFGFSDLRLTQSFCPLSHDDPEAFGDSGDIDPTSVGECSHTLGLCIWLSCVSLH